MILRGSFLKERQKSSTNKPLQLLIVTLISFLGLPFPSLASKRQKALSTRGKFSFFNLDLYLRVLGFSLPGGVEILLVASCYGNRDKLQPDGSLGSYADLNYL